MIASSATHDEDITQCAARQREQVHAAGIKPNICALFDDAVRSFSDRLLWMSIDGGPTYTYAAFANAVGRCTAWLRKLGIGPGTHVGVMLGGVPAVAITWMALARLGAIMIAVNARYTHAELSYIVDKGDIDYLIIDHDFLGTLSSAAHAKPLLDGSHVIVHGASSDRYSLKWDSLMGQSDPIDPDTSWIQGDQIMSLQFTSGTSGFPKGCVLAHDYWTTIAAARAAQGPHVKRMLIDMPFYYMGGQWRFLTALVMGATAVVAPRPSLASMVDRLIAYQIDFCSVSPAMAKMAPHPEKGKLNLAWAGTMALPPDLHKPLQHYLNGARVREMYGLTETGAVLAMPVLADEMDGSGSCGLPVPFRECRVKDENGNDVPAGTVGELCVRGPGIMQGYYKNPEANRAAFRDGWFRTGDLFFQDERGFFRIKGRIKDVIRRSGENISASEVEHVVGSMPGILEVAAVPVPDTLRGEELKVCVVLVDTPNRDSISPETILSFCKGRLASFKMPRYIEYLSELPKTASGKIAKAELRSRPVALQMAGYDLVEKIWR